MGELQLIFGSMFRDASSLIHNVPDWIKGSVADFRQESAGLYLRCGIIYKVHIMLKGFLRYRVFGNKTVRYKIFVLSIQAFLDKCQTSL